MRQITVQLAPKSKRVLILAIREVYPAPWKMVQAASMVGMKMGDDDRADILRRNPKLAKLRPDLIVRFDIEAL